MLYSKNWTYRAIFPVLFFFFMWKIFTVLSLFLLRIHSAVLFQMVDLCSHNSCLLADYILAAIDWSCSIFHHPSFPVFKYLLFYSQLVWAWGSPRGFLNIRQALDHWVASCPEIGFFRYPVEIMVYLCFWIGILHLIMLLGYMLRGCSMYRGCTCVSALMEARSQPRLSFLIPLWVLK